MATLVQQIDNAANVQPLIKESLEKIQMRIVQQMAANNRNASGRSVASLRVETTGASGTLWGSKSFKVMERGRRGGAIPRGFVGIISQWIKDKGISVYNTPHSAAWHIARKIATDGTRLSHRPPQDIYSKAIAEEFDILTEKLGVRFGSAINYVNAEYAKTT